MELDDSSSSDDPSCHISEKTRSMFLSKVPGSENEQEEPASPAETEPQEDRQRTIGKDYEKDGAVLHEARTAPDETASSASQPLPERRGPVLSKVPLKGKSSCTGA